MHQAEIKLGLTAFASSRIIRPVRSQPLGMANPISESILLESHSTRNIGPLGVGKGFDPSPQAFDTNSTPENLPRLVIRENVVAPLISDKDNPASQELLALNLLEKSLDLDFDRYEPPSPPPFPFPFPFTPFLSSVLGQVLPSEEPISLRGNVTLDFPLPLAITPTNQSSVDYGAHPIDKAEGNWLLPTFEAMENSSLIRYPSKNLEEPVGPSSVGPKEKQLEMVPSRQDSCNPDY